MARRIRPLRRAQVELELVQGSLAEGLFEGGALPEAGDVRGVELSCEARVEAVSGRSNAAMS